MAEVALFEWLQQQQSTLENIFLRAAEKFYERHHTRINFPYDCRITNREFSNLSKGQDLCYDRYTVGFMYSLWYHPQRVNTFLKYFASLIYEARHEPAIEIFDLGAGIGAILWAAGLVVHGLKEMDEPCPRIKVINVDTSPFMLIYGSNYLWREFRETYYHAQALISDGCYHLNSWTDTNHTPSTNIWLCASYLFDSSDNADHVAAGFQELAQRYKPNKILLQSSFNKRSLCDKVAERLAGDNYKDKTGQQQSHIFSGPLNELYRFRSEISHRHQLGLFGTPQWNTTALYGKVLIAINPALSLGFTSLPLYVKPEKDKARLRLTHQQEDAAKPSQMPTLITGPAGSGKSIVLIKKIENILAESKDANGNYNPRLKILLTTFNKELVRSLGDWIEQILPANSYRRYFPSDIQCSEFKFEGSMQNNISVMHFDVLPTRIGNVHYLEVGRNYEAFHRSRMLAAAERYSVANTLDRRQFAKILDPDFLLDEYQRIIYGFDCNNLLEYKAQQRHGRGNNPRVHTDTRREIVWYIINDYLTTLKSDNLESFIVRRHKWLHLLQRTIPNQKFTHILVDEFQDCTSSDYEIFFQHLEDANMITLAGDRAQSINLGKALPIPNADNRRRFAPVKKLKGSFRLPFRVSECIRPLSLSIQKAFGVGGENQVDLIEPYRGAPPGARPIFVSADNSSEAIAKVKAIYEAYSPGLKLNKITIYEIDTMLRDGLRNNGINADTEIILRTKGLEKDCVLWSTRINIDTLRDHEEFVYTILTRTVSLLIILAFPFADAHFSETPKEHSNIFMKLDEQRLIFWDEASEQYYNQQRGDNGGLIEVDPEDDPLVTPSQNGDTSLPF